MPTHGERYHGQWFSSNGRWYHFKIYHKGYTSTAHPLKVGGGGVKLKYDTSGQDKFSPIMASKCNISLMVENNPFGLHFENFVEVLRTTAEEGDATFVMWNDNSAYPLWSGNIMLDLSAKEDVSKPYEIELSATDGLGLLKNYDMVQTQGSNPYAEADTYVPLGNKRFTYWLAQILEFCNTPDSDSTDGDVGDYTFSTSIDWWYEDHPTATSSISPLHYTKCRMAGSYELKDDGRFKVKSVYKVLESICKLWGMKVVFWKNQFHFVQLELYRVSDSGTYVSPDDIDTQIFTKAGSFSSGQSFLGNTWFSLYTQEIENNLGGFEGGLQKLAGSKWDYYPKLKEVSVDFATISNNNLFQSFPPVTSSMFGIPLADGLTSTPAGIIKDASTFGGFNINIVLEFDSPVALPSWTSNFSIRARPDGDTDWDNAKYLDCQAGLTPSWANYPQESTSGATGVWYDYFISTGSTAFNFYQQGNVLPNPRVMSIPAGTSQQTIFSQQVPTDSAFVGDWEFEIFTLTLGNAALAVYMGNMAIVGGHSTTAPSNTGMMLLCRPAGSSTWANEIAMTYTDVYDIVGNPVSQINPILNSVIGGGVNTSVYSATSDTESQQIKDIWWGDTLTNGEPASLRWVDGSGSTGYTDSTGKWRRGTAGTFNKTIVELLAESRLYSQQTADYKWSLTTAVSKINAWKNDGTASRPVYVNPVGRIQDTRQQIFYYMLRGSFNLLNDEWDGEWLEISYNDGISTTTTTTQTGGSNPTNNLAGARLAGPSGGRSAASVANGLSIGTLSARAAAYSTITELTIYPLNPAYYIEEGYTSLYVFNQDTIIKSGDVFNVINSNGVWQQFTASADVSNLDLTISVESVDLEQPLEVGSSIMLNIRDSYQQLNHKSRGSVAGFTIDSDGIAKDGIEITGWLDSDTMSGAAATNVPTAESVKAYVDSSITQEFLMATCTGTVLSSATNGEAYAATIPFDTESIQSTGEDVFISTTAGEENNIKTLTNGVYQFNWSVACDTSVTNNRLNCGVKLQEGTYDEGEDIWNYADLDPSHSYIYNRANGSVARLGSTSGSLLVNCNSAKIYRLVFWKDSGSSATTKGITEIDGTQLTVRKIM